MEPADADDLEIPPIADDGTPLALATDETHIEERRKMVRLLKTPFQGGILILTNVELILGEGWLGARNVRRFSLQQFARLDVVAPNGQERLQRGRDLHFVWMSGETTVVKGVGPVAAERIAYVLRALRRPTMRQYMA